MIILFLTSQIDEHKGHYDYNDFFEHDHYMDYDWEDKESHGKKGDEHHLEKYGHKKGHKKHKKEKKKHH